jgi:3-hydroxybutyryl-CoA dehydratase
MQVGNRASITRRFSRDDLQAFQTMTGGNSASLRQVPEPLIGALFSYLLGVELPGFGTNYLKQEMHFEAIAPVDEPLTATVEITRLRPEKHLADLATVCVDGAGKTICRGRALVLVRDVGA